MPVLALCEKGLILDVFGVKPAIYKCHAFDCKQDTLAIFFSNSLQFINIKDLSVQRNVQASDVSSLRLSDDGRNLAVHMHSGALRVFRDTQELFEISQVELFSISNTFCCTVSKSETKVFDLGSREELLTLKFPVKAVFAFNTAVFLVSEKAADQKILMFRDGKLTTCMTLPQIYRAVVRGSVDEKQFLLLVDTEYTKNSYYPESTLFLVTLGEIDAKFEPESTECTVPSVVSSADGLTVLHYRNMIKIHSIGFLKRSFYVCFGDQPASLYQFNLNGTVLKRHSSTIRNTVIFNSRETRIINAGLGNLPGNIDVFSGDGSTGSFDMLGVSIVSWLNDDSHFMAAITNYFKSQNKIVVFDYYGRPVEEMECRSLIDARVYGESADETVIEAPEVMSKVTEAVAYVPPHLQGKAPMVPAAAPVVKKGGKGGVKGKGRSREAVEKELKECVALRDRLRGGEELTLDDENRIFKIKALEDELKLLSKSKL